MADSSQRHCGTRTYCILFWLSQDNPPPHPTPTRTPNLYWLMFHKFAQTQKWQKTVLWTWTPSPHRHLPLPGTMAQGIPGSQRQGWVSGWKKEPVSRGTSPANAWAPSPTGERSGVQCSRWVAVQTPGCFSSWPAAPPYPATRLATDRDTEGIEG